MGGDLHPPGRTAVSDPGEKAKGILSIFMFQKTGRLGCQSSVNIVVQRLKASRKDPSLGHVLALLLPQREKLWSWAMSSAL